MNTTNNVYAQRCIETLVNENIDVVAPIVRRFRTLDINDATSEGGYALFMAAKRFVETGQVGSFRGYACLSIRNALIDLLKYEARRNCYSLDYTSEDSEGKTIEASDYIEEPIDDYTSMDDSDMLQDFYNTECTEPEQHYITVKVSMYRRNRKVTQAQVAAILAEKYNEVTKQAGLCKKVKKLETKFGTFVQACERGDMSDV